MPNHDESDLSSDSIDSADSIIAEEISEESSETDSSEEQDDINVWDRIQNQAMERHQQEHEILVEKYIQDGDSDEIAEIRADNALLPTYRKELREVLFQELKWMHHLKSDPTYKKIMETKNNLIISDGCSWEEAMQSAIHQRKFLLNRLFSKVEVPKQNSIHTSRFHPYGRTFSGFQ